MTVAHHATANTYDFGHIHIPFPDEDSGDLCQFADFFVRKYSDGKIGFGLSYVWNIREKVPLPQESSYFICDETGKARYKLLLHSPESTDESLSPLSRPINILAPLNNDNDHRTTGAVLYESLEDVFEWLQEKDLITRSWKGERHSILFFELVVGNSGDDAVAAAKVIVSSHVCDAAMRHLDKVFNTPLTA